MLVETLGGVFEMNPVMRVLRPAQKILSGAIVAAVATTCLVSASTTNASTPSGESGHSSVATKEWKTKEWKVAPGSQTLATKEWKSRTQSSSSIGLVAQSAFPALSTRTYEQRVLRHVNRVRHNHGLRALTFASCANRVANRWSAHLAETNRFYHQSMAKVLDRCDAAYAGETLGTGTIYPATLVNMWMHSAPHRHILMSKSPRRVGIGATPDGNGRWVVAANFLRL